MIDIPHISSNLRFSDHSGLWLSDKKREISYPEDGNEVCSGIEQKSFWYRHRNKCIMEVFKKFVPEGAVFDIGGGNGVVSKALQESGIEVYLVEPGLQGALNAVRNGVRHVICSSLEDSGFKEKTLPSAGLFDVLEHCENDREFLIRLHTLLMNKGRLYLTVPAFDYLWSANDIQVGHFRRYTLTGLQEIFTQCGYVIEYATYYFTFLLLPAYLYRTLPHKLGIKRNITPHAKKNEHLSNHGILKKCAELILEREVLHIKNGKKMKFGCSCILVAHKREQ